MNRYYFNRIYSLTIGYPAKDLKSGFEAGKAKTISGLRLTFDITKTETPESNSCMITINNLSEATRNFIKPRTSKNEGMIVTLRAGYEEMNDVTDLPVLFFGDITNVSHDITKPDVVTTLECNDGHISIKTSRFAKSYRSGVRIAQIIKDIVKELGLTMQYDYEEYRIKTGIPDYKLNRVFSFDGLASDALNRICSGYGLRWSVQNNAIKMYLAADSSGNPGTDDKLPYKSVLIGSPKRVVKEMKGVDSIDFKGYEFRALLMPNAEPGSRVSISSKSLEKPVTLAVAEVHHKGDTHGTGDNTWTTTVKARNL